MQIEPDESSSPVRPGDRLTKALWLAALTRNGHLPSPTVERIRAIKAVVASWETSTDG